MTLLEKEAIDLILANLSEEEREGAESMIAELIEEGMPEMKAKTFIVQRYAKMKAEVSKTQAKERAKQRGGIPGVNTKVKGRPYWCGYVMKQWALKHGWTPDDGFTPEMVAEADRLAVKWASEQSGAKAKDKEPNIRETTFHFRNAYHAIREFGDWIEAGQKASKPTEPTEPTKKPSKK